MKNKTPPFEITNATIDLVAEIAELVSKFTTWIPRRQTRHFGAPIASEQSMVPLPSSRTHSPWSRSPPSLTGNKFWHHPKTLQRSKTPTRFTSGWMNWTSTSLSTSFARAACAATLPVASWPETDLTAITSPAASGSMMLYSMIAASLNPPPPAVWTNNNNPFSDFTGNEKGLSFSKW